MPDKTTYIREAQKYLSKGQVDKAIAEWEKLVKEYPDGNNYNSIGDIYLRQGDKKNAIESYHKAANFFRHEGFSLKALALFKKVLNINPSDAAALYSLGELSEEKELITDAIKYYLATADSLAKDGKKNELFDIYSKILSLSPSNIALRLKVAEILFKEGLKSDAAKEYLSVAEIYKEKGDLQKAKEYYQKSFDMQPLNKDTVIGLSSLYEKTDELDKAIELMKEAAVIFREDPDILIRSAELSLRGNFIDNAKSCLTKVNDIDPNNVKARSLLGEIYSREGSQEKAWVEYLIVLDDMFLKEQYDDMVQLLERFKEIDPVETHQRLLSLYKRQGEVARVIEELTLLGDVYYDREKKDKALSCYAEALNLAPGNAYLKERISELQEKDLSILSETLETTDHQELFEDKIPLGPEAYNLFEAEAPAESPFPHLSGETANKVSDHISIKSQKPVDEVFTEADIFFRYGLLNEALDLLEGLKSRIPKSSDLHVRLKNIYSDLGDKESAVTECLILSEVYKRSGDTENYEKVLREGYELSPSDPRLAEKGFAALFGPTSFAPGGGEKFSGSPGGENTTIEDYEEELAEADFYTRQGLIQEALDILRRLEKLFPEKRAITERLEALGEDAALAASNTTEQFGNAFELSEDEVPPQEELFERMAPVGNGISGPELQDMGYEEFSITEDDLIEAQQVPEPMLDNDVLEVFKEFKKGLEHELEDEDSETHYNLGIAYKEMGLIDDAIKEFQTAKNDKKRFLQASSMLGICYMEKKLYSLAVDVLSKTLASITERDDSYWSIKYDLAEAYEKNNNLKESLDLYTEVYGWNAKFRDVSEKVGTLKTLAGKGVGKEKTKVRKDRVSYL